MTQTSDIKMTQYKADVGMGLVNKVHIQGGGENTAPLHIIIPI